MKLAYLISNISWKLFKTLKQNNHSGIFFKFLWSSQKILTLHTIFSNEASLFDSPILYDSKFLQVIEIIFEPIYVVTRSNQIFVVFPENLKFTYHFF